MKFTGANLRLIHTAVDLAIDELHNEMATCPDVIHYSEMLNDLQEEQDIMKRLLIRIENAIEKEQAK